MKSFRFLTLMSAILLIFSCNKEYVQTDVPVYDEDAVAYFRLGLSADTRLQILQTKSDAAPASQAPVVDSFYVELYKYSLASDKAKDTTWNRTYFGKYEDAKDSVFRVSGGKWKFYTFYGDSTGCGFDKPYFNGEYNFDVTAGVSSQIQDANIEATVKNVKIAVEFDETISGSFYDYFVRLTSLDKKKYGQVLRYKSGETRSAFMMPSDSLQIEFMAQFENRDTSSWKFAILDTLKTSPNDSVHIGLSIEPRLGSLTIEISSDDNIIRDTADFSIDPTWSPQDAPKIAVAGFPDYNHPVVEGDRSGNNATVSVVAKGGLKNFFLTVTSDISLLSGLPRGVKIDLADTTGAFDSYHQQLRDAGFDWDPKMAGSRRLTYLTMSKLFEFINDAYKSTTQQVELVTFDIQVVDEVGKTESVLLKSTSYPVVQTLSIPEGDVWAKKIVNPEVSVTRGFGHLFTLQVSKDGNTWQDLTTPESATVMSSSSGTVIYPTLEVEPAKTYYYRSIYNKNSNLVSNTVKVTTEAALQVGNPGFEQYHNKILTVSRWFDKKDREWYLPYSASDTDPWWAVNSRATMPSSTTPEYFDYKCFPCTAFSTMRNSGEKSAMIYTVSVDGGNMNTTSFGDNIPGELWIGKTNDNGDHVTDGRPFASRPTSVKFYYHYLPLNSETFEVSVWVKDAGGNVIGKGGMTDGPAASEFTLCEIPINYSNINAKAATLYIGFKSTSSNDPSVRLDSSMEIAGKNQTSHLGSVLRIDDIELTY